MVLIFVGENTLPPKILKSVTKKLYYICYIDYVDHKTIILSQILLKILKKKKIQAPCLVPKFIYVLPNLWQFLTN